MSLQVTNGALPNVFHFDSKAKVDEHIKSIGLPASFFNAGFFMSNFPTGFVFRKDPSIGGYAMHVPIPASSPLPMFDTRDTGKFVRGMVQKDTPGQRVLAATGYYTIAEVIDAFKKVYPEEGSKARHIQLTEDQYTDMLETQAHFPPHVALELKENMLLLDRFGYFNGESLDDSIAVAGGIDNLTTPEQHFRDAPQFKDLR